MNDKTANVSLVLLAVCTLTVTGLVVRREFASPPSSSATSGPRMITKWEDYAKAGRSTGSPTAPITVLTFADYQCPFCKHFSNSLERLREKYKDSVRIVIRQFPIEAIHPYALDAALAAECAGEQGQFYKMDRVLYAEQDSLGRREWGVLAAAGGVRDTAKLSNCVRDRTMLPRIRADMAAAEQLGVRGTPAVILNGLFLPGTPSFHTLDSIAGEILRGRKT